MQKNKKNILLVCDEMVTKYNATGAYVFAHIAYHICTHGSYDSAPSTAARYIKCSKSTVIQYIKKFLDDGLVAEVEGKKSFRKALEIPKRSKYSSIFNRYFQLINKTGGKSNLVMVNTCEIKESKTNEQEFLRKIQFFKSWSVDKLANQKLNNKYFFTVDNYATLAHQFNLAINTIKKVLKELKASKLVKCARKLVNGFNVIVIASGIELRGAIDKKVRVIKPLKNKKYFIR